MLQRLKKQGKSEINRTSSDVLSILQNYPWPGNVRELENMIHRASAIAQGDTILLKDLPREIANWASENEEKLNVLISQNWA